VSKGDMSEKAESSILTGSKPQCLMRLQVISVPTDLLFKRGITAPNMGKHTGQFTEILRLHFEKLEG